MSVKYNTRIAAAALVVLMSVGAANVDAQTGLHQYKQYQHQTIADPVTVSMTKIDNIAAILAELVRLVGQLVVNNVALNSGVLSVATDQARKGITEVSDSVNAIIKEFKDAGFVMVKMPDGSFVLTTEKSLSASPSVAEIALDKNVDPSSVEKFMDALGAQ